jgi:hypothetical protein
MGCGSFAASTLKRQFAEAYDGIKADPDFHESEGLESFDPKAAAAARALRNEGMVAK